MRYEKSRDLAWQILINQNISSLPVKISSICRSMGYVVTSYERGHDIIMRMDLSDRTEDNDGFTANGIIFYNQQCTVQRIRFTVAHELGHILLHNGSGIYNREPADNDNPIEHEANIFASRLIMPACVLWALGVQTAEQISQICDVSMPAAEFRMKRLNTLYAREDEYIQTHGHSCFLMSPLEREVYKQFKEYIDMHK